MGFAKKEWMRQQDQGYSDVPTKTVCANCVNDSALARVVKEAADSTRCDYCKRRKRLPFACQLDTVVSHMSECIGERYTDAVNELGWDNESEGGFVGETFDGWDLLENMGFEVDEELFRDVAVAFNDTVWSRRDAYTLDAAERRETGWSKFKYAVQHKRRYTFWSMKDDDVEEYHPDYLPVGKMLAEIKRVVVNTKVVRSLPRGTAFWRARVHKPNEVLRHDHEFSAPPEKRAKANRMSPPGIAMFYGAEDFETACIEIVDGAEVTHGLTGARFLSVKDLNILDLVALPRYPSAFEKGSSNARYDLEFLYAFARDIARPIESDGSQHIEYVPTQAFTEYVRYQMKHNGTERIYGIRYKSSKNGRPCMVLFCGQDECITSPNRYPRPERWLDFDKSSLQTTNVAELLKSVSVGRNLRPKVHHPKTRDS